MTAPMTNLQSKIQDLLAEFSQRLVHTFAETFQDFAAAGVGKGAAKAAAPAALPAAAKGSAAAKAAKGSAAAKAAKGSAAAKKKPGPKPGVKTTKAEAAAAAPAAATTAAAASAPAAAKAPAAKPAKAAAAKPAKAAKATKGKKRGSAADGRRLPAETEAVARKFADHVKAHPGQRIREIGKALGMSTDDLALPVIKALGWGWVVKSGERSATEYHPADGKKKG